MDHALSLGFYGVKGGIFTIVNCGVYRVQGPGGTFIGGNNEIALAMVMAIPLIRYLHLQETSKWIKMGLASAMVLTGVAAIGTQSRGGLVAMAAMGLFLWFKSRHKFFTAIYMVAAIAIMAAIMPQAWYDRMATIETYQEDKSAQGRINAWHTAFNVAKGRVTGGGFEMWIPPVYRQYAPDPYNVRAMSTASISKSWVSTASLALPCLCCLDCWPGYAPGKSSSDARRTPIRSGHPTSRP